MDTQTPTLPTATLPNGTTIAPNQVNTGTKDAPNIITTSTASRNTTNQNSSDLDNALSLFNINNTPSTNTSTGATGTNTDTTAAIGTTTPTDGTATTTDPYLQSLKTISDNSDASSKLLVQNILTAKQNQSAAVDKQYDAYKRGLQLMGVQTNEAQSSPDLLAGHINEAEDAHQSKLQTIQMNVTKALADAATARNNNDFKTLNAQMAYVKQLNAEKQTELKNYQSTLTQQPKIASNVAHSVYETLQTLDPNDQEQFIQAVAQQYKLPLGSLVTALSDEHLKTTAAATKAASAQATAEAKEILSPAEAKTLGVKYGTTKAEAAKLGIVPTTKTSGSGTGTISKEQISDGEKKLNAAKGNDKYVDPYVYQQAYDSWTQRGGTTAKFISTYPPKDYVNPAATNLPKYLMPAKSKAASSRTS